MSTQSPKDFCSLVFSNFIPPHAIHSHMLDKSDSRWFHVKEVERVKVVLCRFACAKARQNLPSGCSSPDMTLTLKTSTSLEQPEDRTDQITNALAKGLREVDDGSSFKCTFGSLLQNMQDKGMGA